MHERRDVLQACSRDDQQLGCPTEKGKSRRRGPQPADVDEHVDVAERSQRIGDSHGRGRENRADLFGCGMRHDDVHTVGATLTHASKITRLDSTGSGHGGEFDEPWTSRQSAAGTETSTIGIGLDEEAAARPVGCECVGQSRGAG